MLLFIETPGMKPIFDRSPTSIRRTLNNSPSSVNNNNKDKDNNQTTNTPGTNNSNALNSQQKQNPSTLIIRSHDGIISNRNKTEIVLNRGILNTHKKSIFTEQANSKSTVDFTTTSHRSRSGSNFISATSASLTAATAASTNLSATPPNSTITTTKQSKQNNFGLTSLQLKPATVEGRLFFKN